MTRSSRFAQNTDNSDSDPTEWLGHLFAGHLGTSNYLFADGHVKAMRPLQTVNAVAGVNGPPNLWRRDNAAFTANSGHSIAITTLNFAENKYK